MNPLTAFIGLKGILFLLLAIPCAVAAVWHRRARFALFAYLTGSAVAWVILEFVAALAFTGVQSNPFLIAFAIIVIIGVWKFLFGPWDSRIKAGVLGAFIFWIGVDIIAHKPLQEQLATLLAAAIAAIPAAIWCLLFLREHIKRFSVVILTFFSGMLSTAPILFYDHVVQKGYELHFFLFRITPESFMRSSRTFVTQALTGEPGVLSASVAVTVVSFALVGVIEEWSKHWVTKKSDPAYFASVNDVIQLSIIAAIGFAFAENIVNPNYFIAFVKDFLVHPNAPKWGGFLASVFGRSVITNMVHITSSGVLGYFYGLAFFAKPALEDDRAHGKRHRIIVFFHAITGASRITVYRDCMMALGLFWAIALHSAFDVAVSLPEALPGNPQTIGDLVSFAGPFSGINLVLLPALAYVFGGFALITHLLHKKEDIREFGYRFRQEVFVNPASVPV